MKYWKATIEVLIAVNDEAEAADCISETMRPLLREFQPGSPVIDWRYAGGADGYAEPHNGDGFEYA